MPMSIRRAVETLIAAVPGAPFAHPGDTIKIGEAAQALTGEVVTFLANSEVIEETLRLGANLSIRAYNPRSSGRHRLAQRVSRLPRQTPFD